MNNQTHTFHVHGMHCKACEILTESELRDLPNVTNVKSSLKNHSIEVTGDFGNKTPEQIAAELTLPLESHGYKVSVEKQIKEKKWGDFKVAIPIALIFAILFVSLQKLGLVNLVNTGGVTYGTAFVIGIIASLSTCMAVVGGLVLSMSATFAREGDRVRPQVLFHFGRIISFFLLGGVIGVLGATFQLGTTGTFVLGMIVGLVMLIMGINLLDVFHFAKKFQPAMPKFISKHALGVSKFNHTLTPLLVGIATFFLPCGFTQSMQIYTLSTGNFWSGGLTMLSFALGTLPVLVLISFSSFSIQNSSKSGIFFKSAGLIVIAFALFNIANSLAAFGLILPQNTVSNINDHSQNYSPVPANNVTIENGKQIVEIKARGGYTPRTSVAKSGLPTILRFNTSNTFDCSSSVRIPSLNISKSLPSSGLTDIELPNSSVGTLRGTCGMGMYPFEIDFQS
jgi:sulfite exporter TauE/SafE/copper chaperone CopZ